jgi:hypothetical protein
MMRSSTRFGVGARIAGGARSACRPPLAANQGKCQPACKPGSVWGDGLPAMTIHLRRALLRASSNQPGRRPGNLPGSALRRCLCRPYSVLLPAGFTVPRLLPAARCALTAPFHPYPGRVRGGLLSVALSLGSPPPDVIRRRVSLEPGLSSARLRAAVIQPTGAVINVRHFVRVKSGQTAQLRRNKICVTTYVVTVLPQISIFATCLLFSW